jgi:hypothetical protein
MATDESGFKQELKESVQRLFSKQFSWCPTDKIQSGVTDLHIITDKFYGIEVKFCKKIPKKDSSKLLSYGFTPKQVRFMSSLNNTSAAFGIGIVWLNATGAVLIHPSQMDVDGNISKADVTKLWRELDQGISKNGKNWDIQKIMDVSKRWEIHG